MIFAETIISTSALVASGAVMAGVMTIGLGLIRLGDRLWSKKNGNPKECQFSEDAIRRGFKNLADDQAATTSAVNKLCPHPKPQSTICQAHHEETMRALDRRGD